MAAAMNRPSLVLSHHNRLFREGLHILLTRHRFVVVRSAQTIRDAVSVSHSPQMVVCGLDYHRTPESEIDELQQCRPVASGYAWSCLHNTCPRTCWLRPLRRGSTRYYRRMCPARSYNDRCGWFCLGKNCFPQALIGGLRSL